MIDCVVFYLLVSFKNLKGADGMSRKCLGEDLRQSKIRKAKEGKTQYPKGFDILLSDAIVELSLTVDNIKELQAMMKDRHTGLAHATMGTNVFYRRAQLERLFTIVTVDEMTLVNG
jgi:hypothetical protein